MKIESNKRIKIIDCILYLILNILSLYFSLNEISEINDENYSFDKDKIIRIILPLIVMPITYITFAN